MTDEPIATGAVYAKVEVAQVNIVFFFTENTHSVEVIGVIEIEVVLEGESKDEHSEVFGFEFEVPQNMRTDHLKPTITKELESKFKVHGELKIQWPTR